MRCGRRGILPRTKEGRKLELRASCEDQGNEKMEKQQSNINIKQE